MYYSLTKSFDNISDEEINNRNICIICLENVYIKKQTKNVDKQYIFLCKCKPKIHEICLQNWMKISKTCPICRKNLLIRKNYVYPTNIIISKYVDFVFNIFAVIAMISGFFIWISIINSFFECLNYNLDQEL
jgi:hypothetical protein